MPTGASSMADRRLDAVGQQRPDFGVRRRDELRDVGGDGPAGDPAVVRLRQQDDRQRRRRLPDGLEEREPVGGLVVGGDDAVDVGADVAGVRDPVRGGHREAVLRAQRGPRRLPPAGPVGNEQYACRRTHHFHHRALSD
ncbi:hypothetical protein BRD02_09685 [Halobacteriales archaeon QS_8_69_73]|nr:MAG: hypothetical protein BRD02_09685 [Halobacteriales archaeon QS_8_69_73]